MILLTGASGFLGQHLLRFLSAQGLQVRALYNNNAPSKELQSLPGVTWAKHDLLDIYAVEDAMQDITDVYHCAAIVSFDPRRKDEMTHFNVESTANIVNQALEQGIRKMLYVSSVAALGRNEKQGKEIAEEEEWEESMHNSGYGMSKYLAELEVWRGIGEGLDAVVINPAIILGAGDWNEGSAQLMKIVYKEFPFYTQGVTGWVDVHDVVKAAYMLMQSDVSDERFILSAGNFGYRDIFTRMAQALNKRPPHIRATPLMTSLVWRWSTLKNRVLKSGSIITRETARNAQTTSIYNNSKLLAFLPTYQYTPVDETIAGMANAFLANTHGK